MYYIYFPYIAILASLMLYECYHRNHPRWWAVMVLFAPVTTPYFIFKSRRESGIVMFMIFLTTFSAVSASEVFLYSKHMVKNRYTTLSPVALQIIRLSEEVKKSTLKLDHALIKLESLSKIESRIHEIEKTIEFIAQLRKILVENQETINRLVKYTSDYKGFLNRNDLEWVFHVQTFYHDRNVIQHYKSIEEYLDAFESLLKYTYVNFNDIIEHQNKEVLKNYDEYYMRYRRAYDSHNRFNVKRIDFQNSFLEKYPDIKPYLPGERQTDTFKLWG